MIKDVLKPLLPEELEGFELCSAEYPEYGTGITVILARNGAVTGADIRGGAPASRENGLLNPLASNNAVHAVVLAGSSAYGLSASDGVMKYLEEQNIGFPTDYGVVPIVCSSCLFDLGFISGTGRADSALGYKACAEPQPFREGNYGAGCGATVGKILGAPYCMKSGIGFKGYRLGDLWVAAVVAVNAAGDIYDPDTNQKLAGMYDRENKRFLDAEEALYRIAGGTIDLFNQNTTIGAVLTNGKFDKTELTKIAGMAHDGFARAIRLVHTQFDGDTIYAMSTASVPADINTAGTLAARAMAEAIASAVLHAEDAGGLPANRSVTGR
ncbi:MAG: P1 family peptidase [Solobacterium sp.]|nr:P1 family peptidase [Solobacterium sp.]